MAISSQCYRLCRCTAFVLLPALKPGGSTTTAALHHTGKSVFSTGSKPSINLTMAGLIGTSNNNFQVPGWCAPGSVAQISFLVWYYCRRFLQRFQYFAVGQRPDLVATCLNNSRAATLLWRACVGV